MKPDNLIDQKPSVKNSGLVFLTGGTALNQLASCLAVNGLSAIHLVTVFDDGGSTGSLRQYLAEVFKDECIAVGDIRNRLMALSCVSSEEAAYRYNLFAYRFAANKPNNLLWEKLSRVIRGKDGVIKQCNIKVIQSVSSPLSILVELLGPSFNLRGASLGNLILYGRYLLDGEWTKTLDWAHEFLSACGQVLPITLESRYLAAILQNGDFIVGQEEITSEKDPLSSPINRVYLCHSHGTSAIEATAKLLHQSRQKLLDARVIVYSWGSFYTSIISNLLVDGLGEILLTSNVPKVLLLNPAVDAETNGFSPIKFVREINRYTERVGQNKYNSAVTHIVVFKKPEDYSGSPLLYQPEDKDLLESEGIEVNEIESGTIPDAETVKSVGNILLDLAGSHSCL